MIGFKDVKDNFKRYLSLFRALYRDKRTPKISKILLWSALGYFLMPIDLIPDFIPVLGQLDDAIIVPGLVVLALKFIPKEVYKSHYKRLFKKKKAH